MWPDEITLNTHFPGKAVADHELFISFDNDDDALAFDNWLQADGWAAYAEWRKTNTDY